MGTRAERTLVEGRDPEKAVLLLAAAESLDLPPSVVETTSGGYLVPEEVAQEAGLSDGEAPAKKKTAKKAPAKKTAAKKTTAKKASSTKSKDEE